MSSKSKREQREPKSGTRAEPGAEPSKSPLRHFWEQFGTLIVAVILALSIRAFVIEPYRIPSGSMFPTLLIGDHLFVNKFLYGIKVPFTDMRLPGLREPERGDVVVFTVARSRDGQIRPADRALDLPRDRFVKRVVGLPGDRIEVRSGAVYLNGERLETSEDDGAFADEVGRNLRVRTEDLTGHSHSILDDPRQRGPEQRSFEVEPGRYFMMGDNRDWSNDSRSWGTVRLAELKGPAFVLYWSWAWDGTWLSLLNPITWWDLLTDKMRWDRIGASIDGA